MFKTSSKRIILVIIAVACALAIHLMATNWINVLFIFVLALTGVIIRAFLLPPMWLFRIRSWFYGFLLMIYLDLFNFSFRENEYINFTRILHLIIISIVLGFLLGLFNYLRYKKICKKTPLNFLENESEILSDTAYFNNNEIRKAGRVFLTNKRLCFVSLDKEQFKFDLVFTDFSFTIETTSVLLPLPSGIYIKEKNARIMVGFPVFWKREILKVIK